MDGITNKFSVYEFFGIWGAGAITMFYALGAIVVVLNIDVLNILKEFNSDYSLLFIFLFSIAAYLVGVVLHEIGRIIAQTFSLLFDFKSISQIRSKNKENKFYKFLEKHRGLMSCIKPIEYNKIKFISDTSHICEESKKSLSEATHTLKAAGQSNLIDRYHSIYGLTRGIWVGVMLHILLMVFLIVFYKILNTVSVTFLIADILGAIFFFIRTYRYYLVWIKNVYLQYDYYITYLP